MPMAAIINIIFNSSTKELAPPPDSIPKRINKSKTNKIIDVAKRPVFLFILNSIPIISCKSTTCVKVVFFSFPPTSPLNNSPLRYSLLSVKVTPVLFEAPAPIALLTYPFPRRAISISPWFWVSSGLIDALYSFVD